jgi:flagellar biosynthesis anti-sigma factor FlgM
MKIGSHVPLGAVDQGETGPSRVRNRSSESGCVSGDGANFSTRVSDSMRTLAAGLNDIAPIRRERVEALRQSVSSGTYRVDAQAVAESILREHLPGGQ